MTTKRNEDIVSGAQNAILGDSDPMNLPVTEVPKEVLNEEMQAASYTQHPEFKNLKAHLESRREFFQRYLPDGTRIQDVSKEKRDEYWAASCVIVGEIDNILAFYQQAHEGVKDARRQDA